MSSAAEFNFDKVVKSAVEFADENVALVSVGAAFTLFGGLFLLSKKKKKIDFETGARR